MMKYLNPYSVFMDLKNYLYDEKYFKQIQIDTKIISIGNLNTGGSGKTPLIRFVAEILKNKKILIVCKSYKATLKYPSEVNLTVSNAAQIYGDEACLLKQLLPGCDVWSGPSKSSTVFTAMLKRKYDIILIDDGFSHRKIFRHRDIVLIDASRSRNHYQLFPFGQMREDWKTLKRSDLVILTKTEGLPIEKIQFLKEKIKLYQPRWVCAYFKTEFETQPASKKLFLIAAIANPQKLKFDLVNSGYQILKEKIYSDHYAFPDSEQKLLLAHVNSHPELQAVMTGKDFVKITNQGLKNKIVTVEIHVSMSESDRKIFDDQILS